MKEAQRQDDLILELTDVAIRITEYDFEYLVAEVVENALKFSNPGSKVLIKSYTDGNMYHLNVTDHGRGMAKEQITNIVTFCQHERNKYQQNGNGLGLISVKNLASLYCGKLNISSEINQYTTCSLILPVFING
jgi:signal transduction histidine kinase